MQSESEKVGKTRAQLHEQYSSNNVWSERKR